MKIALIGQIYFVEKLAKELRRSHTVIVYDYNQINKRIFHYPKLLQEADILYYFNGVGLRRFSDALFLRYFYRKKIFVHFIGSDVQSLLRTSSKRRLRWIYSLRVVHRVFGVSRNIVEELSPYVNINYLPITFDNLDHKFISFPKTFTALVYLPEAKADFYGYDLILQLVENNRDVHFIILGSNKFLHSKNVELYPVDLERDMSELFHRSSVIIRLTEHDGLSNMVLEALSYGRHVIWTFPLPFCAHVSRDFDSAQKALTSLVSADEDNRQAATWVKKTFNQSQIIDDIEALFANPKFNINHYENPPD